jgi:hypothetical protein
MQGHDDDFEEDEEYSPPAHTPSLPWILSAERSERLDYMFMMRALLSSARQSSGAPGSEAEASAHHLPTAAAVSGGSDPGRGSFARVVNLELVALADRLRISERSRMFLEASPSEWDCALCLASIDLEAATHAQIVLCGHVYHETCWDELVRDKSSCPVCRGPVASVLRHIGTPLARPGSRRVEEKQAEPSSDNSSSSASSHNCRDCYECMDYEEA